MPPAAKAADSDDGSFSFNLVVSGGAKTCLLKATGKVTVTPIGNVEIMDVSVQDLPPYAAFEVFVIQVPKGPFGVSWYQGEIQTNKNRRGH